MKQCIINPILKCYSIMLARALVLTLALGCLSNAFAVTAIYRSIGNTAAAIDTAGGTNGLTIAAGIATFNSPLSNSVGVGDVLQYDSDNNGSIDAYAIIHGRTSSMVYSVLMADGITNPPNVTNDTDWSIFRAYRHLNDIDHGVENASIAGAVSNFDSWTLGRDAILSDEIWHMACYGDATETSSQALGIYGGWDTDATHYIHVYTPTSLSEVGVTQRHSGVWDSTKFNITVATAVGGVDDSTLRFAQLFKVHAEGLQVFRNNGTLSGDVAVFENTTSTPNKAFTFNNNIVKSVVGGGGAINGISVVDNESSTVLIYNNIVYNVNSRGIAEKSVKAGGIGGTSEILNNTVVNAQIGYFIVGINNDGRDVLAQNNIAQGITTHGYDGTNGAPAFGGNFRGTSSANLSNLAEAGIGVGFIPSAAVTFVNSGIEDYRLSTLDAVARNAGVTHGVFTTDIEGYTRGDGAFDIGADEADPVPKAPTAVSVF